MFTNNFVIMNKRKERKMSDSIEFGKVLKRLRLRKKMSQNEVCKKLGLSQQNISSWETGRAIPSSDALLRLLAVYEVDNILSEFGFDTKETFDFKVTPKEKGILLQLRELPQKAQSLIQDVIDYFYNITVAEKYISDNHLIAASGGENATQEEMKTNIEIVKELDKN